jgi:N-acetylmuramoyl-L-alanine amidase
MIVVVGGVITGSRGASSHSDSLSLLAGKGGQVAVMDEISAATVAATVAETTALMVSQEATEKATTLSAQVALPTSDEEHLTKRQVVTTAGDATRSITTYTVAHGDTLSGIASKFNITTSTIKAANDLTDANNLKPGQALTILPVSGLVYTVQAGDTAESLAVKYQANAAQILSYNNAEVKGLVVGQKIIIPDGVKPEVVKPRVAPTLLASASISKLPVVPRQTYSSGINSYSYGYCTYYVKNRRTDMGNNWGNASSWYYNARAAGYATGSVPRPGAVAWRPWGGGGAGHVAIVEAVNADGSIVVSDMNGPAGWNRVARYTVPASSYNGYIY